MVDWTPPRVNIFAPPPHSHSTKLTVLNGSRNASPNSITWWWWDSRNLLVVHPQGLAGANQARSQSEAELRPPAPPTPLRPCQIFDFDMWYEHGWTYRPDAFLNRQNRSLHRLMLKDVDAYTNNMANMDGPWIKCAVNLSTNSTSPYEWNIHYSRNRSVSRLSFRKRMIMIMRSRALKIAIRCSLEGRTKVQCNLIIRSFWSQIWSGTVQDRLGRLVCWKSHGSVRKERKRTSHVVVHHQAHFNGQWCCQKFHLSLNEYTLVLRWMVETLKCLFKMSSPVK
jgi:hypothetical protein